MQINWNDRDPIYRQLRDRIVELILDGVFSDGDSLPSVRQIANEQRINPITVSKAFQLLVEDHLVEKRRGLGMFVGDGAGEKLAVLEKERFLKEEWPVIAGKINRLGLDARLLLAQLETDG
jgi:GntR family transcriptional regulator|tara:strand:- start:4282 stop:4644 length:363 start_codon:yes stop_codon:yes gene_type:complete